MDEKLTKIVERVYKTYLDEFDADCDETGYFICSRSTDSILEEEFGSSLSDVEMSICYDALEDKKKLDYWK